MNSQVSVVIISQNEKYELLRTLKSVKNQIVKPKELIIINYGNNNDKVEAFIHSYLDQSCQYIFKQTQEFNFNEAVREGLKNSTAYWMTFIDCYTKWFPNRLSSIQDLLNQTKVDIVFSKHICYCREKKLEIPFDRLNKMQGIMPESTASLNFVVLKKEVLRKWNHMSFIENNFEPEFLRNSLLKNDVVVCKNVCELVGEEWIFYNEEKEQIYDTLENYLKFYKQFQNDIMDCKKGYAFWKYICSFFSCIYIEKELLEKLMEVTEDKNLRRFLREYQLDVEQQKKDAEKKLERQASFYQLMARWVQLGLDGKKISTYLKKYQKNKICIYGAGKHGLMLSKSLMQEGLKIICFIDKKLAGTEVEDVPVYPLQAALPELDLIIVSPYLEFNAIERDLRQFTAVDIMPMDQLIIKCGE